MSHEEAGLAKERLLCADVTTLERAVTIDMAEAVAANSKTYSWGHDRLALAIGKAPGSPSAKSALTHRIIPALIRKGVIAKASNAYRGHRAEYDLLILDDGWEPSAVIGMGTGSNAGMGTGPLSEMGTGSDTEWVPVLNGMGTAQTGTPPTSTPTSTPTGSARAESDARASDTAKVNSSRSSETKKTAKKNWSDLSEDFAPDSEHITMAADRGVNLADELANFRDWVASTGKRSQDWAAEFRKWLRRARPAGNSSWSSRKPPSERARDVLNLRAPGEEDLEPAPGYDNGNVFRVRENAPEMGSGFFGIAR